MAEKARPLCSKAVKPTMTGDCKERGGGFLRIKREQIVPENIERKTKHFNRIERSENIKMARGKGQRREEGGTCPHLLTNIPRGKRVRLPDKRLLREAEAGGERGRIVEVGRVV